MSKHKTDTFENHHFPPSYASLGLKWAAFSRFLRYSPLITPKTRVRLQKFSKNHTTNQSTIMELSWRIRCTFRLSYRLISFTSSVPFSYPEHLLDFQNCGIEIFVTMLLWIEPHLSLLLQFLNTRRKSERIEVVGRNLNEKFPTSYPPSLCTFTTAINSHF